MRTTLYYGELCSMITGYILKQPLDLEKFQDKIIKNGDYNDCIWTLCADAARVMDEIENSCDNHFLDIPQAVEIYAGQIRDFLQRGEIPWPLDLYKIAIQSLDQTL